MPNRVLLSVKRYKQRPSECALASISSLANFFNSNIDYKLVRKISSNSIFSIEPKSGLDTSQQAMILNELGFKNIVIVSCYSGYDFSWNRFSKEKIIERLTRLKNKYYYFNDKYSVLSMSLVIKWLKHKKYDNKLIIDSDYPKYIKRHLNKNRPVITSINWNSMFKRSKGSWITNQDINGEAESHSIVLRGYNEKHVFVVDSHHRYYNGKLSKYKNGYYTISWEKLCMNMSEEELILV